MAKTVETHKIADDIFIYKADNSKRWFARFKLDGKWYAKTTSKADKNEAVVRAIELRTEYNILISNNAPIHTSNRVTRLSFGKLAKATIADMQKEIDAGTAKSAYKMYIGILNNYHIPFFDKHSIKNIDVNLLEEFDSWRIEQMGKVPSKNTITVHNSAMRMVFNYAVKERVIDERMLPVLKNNGDKGGRRLAFTKPQYKKIVEHIKGWINDTNKPRTKQLRTTLYYYVQFATSTGMRTGTEIFNIKWSDIREEEIDGAMYTTIAVRKGKTVKHTGIRKIVCKDEIKPMLAEYKQLVMPDAKEDDYVFDLQTESETVLLSDNFRTALKKLKLYNTPQGKLTLYSLRHSYITWELQAGTDMNVIATQCGTSVEQIENHYSHVIPTMFADQLSGGAAKEKARLKQLSDELISTSGMTVNDDASIKID